MNRMYDITTLPKLFCEFINTFIEKIPEEGCLFFYPETQLLQPGCVAGDKKQFNLSSVFNEKLDLDDIEYIVRVALCQTHFYVKKIDEGSPERKELYYTLKLFHYNFLLKEREIQNPIQKEINRLNKISEF